MLSAPPAAVKESGRPGKKEPAKSPLTPEEHEKLQHDLARWRELAPMADAAAVTVDDGTETYDATTEGLTPEGALRVRPHDGRVVELSAAEVTIRKSP